MHFNEFLHTFMQHFLVCRITNRQIWEGEKKLKMFASKKCCGVTILWLSLNRDVFCGFKFVVFLQRGKPLLYCVCAAWLSKMCSSQFSASCNAVWQVTGVSVAEATVHVREYESVHVHVGRQAMMPFAMHLVAAH